MVTRAEATQHGAKFAEQWDDKKHTVSEDAIKTFAQDLNSMNSLPDAQRNVVKEAELRGATDGLISKNVLPNLDVSDNKSKMRNCRVVGLTADGDKNNGNDDLVIAIGRKKENSAKAESVVILGQDGKFYQAQEVKGGYVKTQDVIAQNAEELERKYNRKDFTPQTEAERKAIEQKREEAKKLDQKLDPKLDQKLDPKQKIEHEKREDEKSEDDKGKLIAQEQSREKRGNPADLEVFKDEFKALQEANPQSDDLARETLDHLAKTYSELTNEQRKLALQEVMQGNANLWTNLHKSGRDLPPPIVSIQQGADDSVRFFAEWTTGPVLWRTDHKAVSANHKLRTR